MAVGGAGAACLSCALNLAHKNIKSLSLKKRRLGRQVLREHRFFSDFNEDFNLHSRRQMLIYRFSTQ
jgi:thioredoxin reductase